MHHAIGGWQGKWMLSVVPRSCNYWLFRELVYRPSISLVLAHVGLHLMWRCRLRICTRYRIQLLTLSLQFLLFLSLSVLEESLQRDKPPPPQCALPSLLVCTLLTKTLLRQLVIFSEPLISWCIHVGSRVPTTFRCTARLQQQSANDRSPRPGSDNFSSWTPPSHTTTKIPIWLLSQLKLNMNLPLMELYALQKKASPRATIIGL